MAGELQSDQWDLVLGHEIGERVIAWGAVLQLELMRGAACPETARCSGSPALPWVVPESQLRLFPFGLRKGVLLLTDR